MPPTRDQAAIDNFVNQLIRAKTSQTLPWAERTPRNTQPDAGPIGYGIRWDEVNRRWENITEPGPTTTPRPTQPHSFSPEMQEALREVDEARAEIAAGQAARPPATLAGTAGEAIGHTGRLGLIGAGLGLPLGAIFGAARGNTGEGVFRGAVRGGLTGLGAGAGSLLGALGGHALGAYLGARRGRGVVQPSPLNPITQMAGDIAAHQGADLGGGIGQIYGGLGGLALGGLGGWLGSGKLLGKPVGAGKKKEDDTKSESKAAAAKAFAENLVKQANPALLGGGIGAGLGGALGLGYSLSDEEQRKHWLRNTVLGLLAGGGVGAGVGHFAGGTNDTGTQQPPANPLGRRRAPGPSDPLAGDGPNYDAANYDPLDAIDRYMSRRRSPARVVDGYEEISRLPRRPRFPAITNAERDLAQAERDLHGEAFPAGATIGGGLGLIAGNRLARRHQFAAEDAIANANAEVRANPRRFTGGDRYNWDALHAGARQAATGRLLTPVATGLAGAALGGFASQALNDLLSGPSNRGIRSR